MRETAGGTESGAAAVHEAPASLEDVVRTHMPLVGHIVRDVLSRVPAHVSRDDLTSAGFAALVVAARSFDPDRGVAFGSYAATRIRGAVLDELRAVDWASRSVRRRAREVDHARTVLANRLGRAPEEHEVAEALGLSTEEFARHRDDVSRASVLSLQGFGDTPIDELVSSRAPSPEEVAERQERAGYLVSAVAELPERLRVVVSAYFFAERPMTEIAAELGVSESRVSQMRAEALLLLKDVLNHAFEPDRVTRLDRPGGVVDRKRAAYFAAVDARNAAQRRGRPDEGRVAS